MIHFKCNQIKTTQDAALFLKLNGGKMNYMKLIKLMYLTDREALSRWERPLTGDSYFSMKNGPILSNVLDWINLSKAGDETPYWCQYISISNRNQYDVSLKKDPGETELSIREIELIRKIDEEYKDFDKWQMVDTCHNVLPEWKDPQGTSIQIPIEDILKATNKTDEEIALIEEDINTLQYFDTLFSKCI
ncbi:MAG: Panacea domain-containing protein [Candidatus Omnitrophota bacterium]